MTQGDPASESQAGKRFRAARWVAAFLVVLAAVIANFTGTWTTCQVTTLTRAGLPAASQFAKVETAKSCGGPGTLDWLGVLAIIGLLVLPDAQRLKIGGFEFERLARDVQQQTREIERLSQQVSTVVQSSQTLNVMLSAADLAGRAAQGDTVEGSQRAEDVLPGLLDQDPGQ